MKKGFTLVELLVVLAVMAVLSGVDVSLLKVGFDSWSQATGRVSLQAVADELMRSLLEGGFEGSGGLRDAIELRDAGLDAISFVPLWTDTTHVPNPVTNKAQKFTLNKQFKGGAVTPVGQVRKADSEDWISVPVAFDYGSGTDPKKPDDVVTFTDPIPHGAAVRLLYTPDADVHPEVQVRFWLNPDDHQIYRSYAGTTEPVLKRLQGVTVERLAFLYYDNLNRLFPLGTAYSQSELRRITGVKLYLLLTKGEQWKEATSFTNVRNAQTIGATIAKGTVLPLPSPHDIKAFSIGEFTGLKDKGIVELLIKTGNKSRWQITLEFTAGQTPDRFLLHRFQIEAPPGTILTSAILDQPIAQGEFVNLLGLDRTGLYDYDEDPDIKGQLIVKGTSPAVEVTRFDFSVASMFIRP